MVEPTTHNTAITHTTLPDSARILSEIFTPVRFVVFVNSRSYFARTRVLQLSETQISILDSKNNAVRFRHSFEDILGLTKSLRIGSKNFIIHFSNHADEEWHSEEREEIVSVLEEKY
jgi:hypothetical protein